MFTTIIALLTTGAGGGIFGSIFGLFKQNQERKERVEMARVELQRDMMEYKNAQSEREHAMAMLTKGAELKLDEIKVESAAKIELAETEADMEIEVANQKALASAQDALKNLKTTSGMDNYRGSVRPTLAYWAAALFTIMLIWAFYAFGDNITDDQGTQILIGMFGTLTFSVTSIISFYFVSRRNSAPRSN